MDAQLRALFDRLSEDLASLEKALNQTQALLKELAKEARKNGEAVEQRLEGVEATQRFLAGQWSRRDGTFPWAGLRENDDAD